MRTSPTHFRPGFPSGSLPKPAAQAAPAFRGRQAGLATVRRPGFTLIEMATAFALLAILIGLATSVYAGLARARAQGAAQRMLVRAAEEALTAAQTRLTPHIPEGVTVSLKPVEAPAGSKLRWAQATASDGKHSESLRGVVRADWQEAKP